MRYLLREYPDNPAALAMPSELWSGRPGAPSQPVAAVAQPPLPVQPVAPVAGPASPAQPVAMAGPPLSLQAPTIHCQKCGSQNPPAQDRCRECGANLLPGENLASRLGFFIGGILCALVLGGLTYLLTRWPELLPDLPVCNPIALAVGAILGPFAGLWLAVHRTPRYVRHAERAKRHEKLNPSQALADLGQAAALAPKKERPGLLKRRAQLYEQLGLREDATRDLLDEQYSQFRAAQESPMGSRLLVHHLTQVGTFPATESVHIGQSESTTLRELIIIPPEPGVAYLFSCSADIGSYEEFEPVFARAIETLQLAGSVPATAPAGQAPSLISPAAVPPPAIGEQLGQWAASAQASSQYSQSSCAAFQASGEPDTAECGDEITAWAASTSDTVEWIQLDYTFPVYPVQVNIVQTYNPDKVVRVELLDTAGLYHTVYTDQPKALTQCPYTLSIAIDQPNYQAVAVRITIDQSVHQEWNEIDAVELVGFP